MARDLAQVIDQMLAVIPADQTVLREELMSAKTSYEFTSPETVDLRWMTVARVLATNININKGIYPPWEEQVFDIWSG